MAANSQWVTIEGGITNTFPLSINRTAYWTSLRRGECYAQDMTDRTRRGVLSYEAAPVPSSQFFVKTFVDDVLDSRRQLEAAFFYGRWWKVDLKNPNRLLYSDLGKTEPDFKTTITTLRRFVNGELRESESREVENGLDFIEDSEDPIRLIGTDGNGRIFVIKSSCGYVLYNANQDPSVWQKSAPNFSIGTVHRGPSFTNAFLNNNIYLVWNGGGEHGNRHYQWSGGNSAIELSEDIRQLTEADNITTTAAINWSQQLVLVGDICYDMNARRIFSYSGANTASYTSRPLFDPKYRMQTVHRMAFITDGVSGQFDATIEYGQSPDNLQETKMFRVRIKQATRNRFRHVWSLDIPVVARVWRVKINNMQGCSISQIDADISINENPDFEELM